jgi:hypothetical protein
MTRPVALVAIALGLLTAFAVGQLGMLLARPDIATGSRYADVADAEEIVQSFYDGIGNWITSGDRALDLIVTPEFIDHPMGGAPARDRAAFFSQLTSIRETMPDLRFEIMRIETAGTIVTVDLTDSSRNGATLSGWSLELPEDVEFREILRIEGHRIAERWHTSDPWPSGFWSVDRVLPTGAAQLHQPALQGFELDANTEAELFTSGSVVVLVESGTMFVDQSGRDLAGNIQPAYVPIEDGAVRIVEPAGTLLVRNSAGSSAKFWTVSLEPILPPRTPGDAPASAHPLGIRQFANISIAVSLSDHDVRISVCAVTVPADATLDTDSEGMTSVGVIGGQLQIESSTGRGYYSVDSTRFRAVTGGTRSQAALTR